FGHRSHSREVPMSMKQGAICTGLLLMLLSLAGCPGSVYLWEVRTESTSIDPSFNLAAFKQEPVAVLDALSAPGFHGNEVGLALSLKRIMNRVVPNWRLVSPRESVTLINQQGLAAEYTRMRQDYEQSNILDRAPLRKIGGAIGVRYVLQPRLAAFAQTLYDRWKVPGFDLHVVRTRTSILRLALQLWDTETGELIWASTAEGTFQEEAFSDDPVYLREAARITWAGIISDFAHGRTAYRYSSVNKLLDSLIEPDKIEEESDSKPASAPAAP
ncbi:MAG TPA: hypothetical protein VLE03_00395, partial [Nitrospiraceae bacterium]|nr:hypothetical protein [Nitrospiraceae bacterium]